MDNIFYLNSSEKECCLVKKMVDKNGFYYHYIRTNCDINQEKYINSERLLTKKKYPINLCNYYDAKNKKFKEKLGSCRNLNFTCFDFVNKKTCDKYNMRWADVPCNMPITYKNKLIKYKLGKLEV